MDRSYLCLKQHFPLRIISVHFKNIFAFDTRISFTSYWDHANRQYIIRSHKCLLNATNNFAACTGSAIIM